MKETMWPVRSTLTWHNHVAVHTSTCISKSPNNNSMGCPLKKKLNSVHTFPIVWVHAACDVSLHLVIIYQAMGTELLHHSRVLGIRNLTLVEDPVSVSKYVYIWEHKMFFPWEYHSLHEQNLGLKIHALANKCGKLELNSIKNIC